MTVFDPELNHEYLKLEGSSGAGYTLLRWDYLEGGLWQNLAF